jgi:hypothetical protein
MGRFLPKDEAGAGEPAGEDAEAPPQESKQTGTETVDISDTTAPSIGPNTVIEREPPEERLAKHEVSDVDAMGLDKRREVVGQSYAPSFARQAAMYGIFLAVVAALVIGGKLLADELDQPPDEIKAEAPWAGTDEPAAEIDFRPAGDIPTEGP